MGKYFIAIMLAGITALVFSGCDQDRSSRNAEFDRAPTDASARRTDIFDEFYVSNENKAQQEPAATPSGGQPTAAASTPRQQQPTTARSAGEFNFNPRGRYVVQVSNTPVMRDANRMAARLRDMGFPAYVVEVQNPTPELIGTFYRVRIGGFNGLSEAEEFGRSALVPNGYQYWVDRKANEHVRQDDPFRVPQHTQCQQTRTSVPEPQPEPVAHTPAPQPQPEPVAHTPAPQPEPEPMPPQRPAPEDTELEPVKADAD